MRDVLVFLMFLAPTIQYRVDLGGFSVALMEPVVLLAAGGLIVHDLVHRRFELKGDRLIALFLAMTFWAIAIRPLALEWKHGLSDVRDWAVPLVALLALVSSREAPWRRWVLLFIASAGVNVGVGIYQHLTDSFRPFTQELAYKTDFLPSPDDAQLLRASFAVGFFNHPNGFAMYVFMALMAAIGWMADSRRSQLVKILFVIAPFALALWWSFAKTSLIFMVLAGVAFVLERRVRSNSLLAGATLILGGLAAVSLWMATQYLPPEFFGTFWWRTDLWNTAGAVILETPSILAFGNGMELFALDAFYPQPHNLFLSTLLDYGLPGLALIGAALLLILRSGWSARRDGGRMADPLQSALWIALLGYFGVGLVESNLLGIESRMMFFSALACYLGVRREAEAARAAAPAGRIFPWTIGPVRWPAEGREAIAAAVARPHDL